MKAVWRFANHALALCSIHTHRCFSTSGGVFARISRHLHATRMAAGATEKCVYGYCHGFLSSQNSLKAAFFQSILSKQDCYEILDLNAADGSGIFDFGSALDSINKFHSTCQKKFPRAKVRLIGSSLGGYVVARYVELYPDRIDRIFLLCPSFCVSERINHLLPHDEMVRWEAEGIREFERADRIRVKIPWNFIVRCREMSPYPQYRCPAIIVHGDKDEVVPSSVTRHIMEHENLAPLTNIVIVEDYHALDSPSTLNLIEKCSMDFFELKEHSALQNGIIEVEKKFYLENSTEFQARLLAEKAVKIAETVFMDLYYDNAENTFLSKNIWLRKRAGLWELKVPNPKGSAKTAVYNEFTSLNDIVNDLKRMNEERFGTMSTENFDKYLTEAGYVPFVKYITTRIKYSLGDVAVDIDKADFGHELVEIEVLCEQNENVEIAERKICEVADRLNLTQKTRGKVEEYLSKLYPEKLQIALAGKKGRI